jgi:hypothetical protein
LVQADPSELQTVGLLHTTVQVGGTIPGLLRSHQTYDHASVSVGQHSNPGYSAAGASQSSGLAA